MVKRKQTPQLSERTERLRQALLELHRAIIAIEREDHERKAGTGSAAEFLRLLVESDNWSWLRALSALIVQIDEGPETQGRVDSEAMFFTEARKLLKPDSGGIPFQQRYAWLLERSPEVAYAHGRVMMALKS